MTVAPHRTSSITMRMAAAKTGGKKPASNCAHRLMICRCRRRPQRRGATGNRAGFRPQRQTAAWSPSSTKRGRLPHGEPMHKTEHPIQCRKRIRSARSRNGSGGPGSSLSGNSVTAIKADDRVRPLGAGAGPRWPDQKPKPPAALLALWRVVARSILHLVRHDPPLMPTRPRRTIKGNDFSL